MRSQRRRGGEAESGQVRNAYERIFNSNMTNKTKHQTGHAETRRKGAKTSSLLPGNEVLTALREAKGFDSIEKLATAAGMDRSRASKIEHNRIIPTQRDMLKIARALKVDSILIWPARKEKWLEMLLDEMVGRNKAKKKARPREAEPLISEEALGEFY